MSEKAFIHCEVSRSDKAKWVAVARSKGVRLGDFISSIMNAAVEKDYQQIVNKLADEPPAWMARFSMRLRLCLIRANMTEKAFQTALREWDQHSWYKALPNLSQECFASEIQPLQAAKYE